jgi:acyl carrier protein
MLTALLGHCMENGVFPRDTHVEPNDDLVELGLIDSMGLLMLAAMIEDVYDVVIPEPVFVAELRTLERIAAYIESEVRAGRGRVPRAQAAN